ncbi:hypothetical protein [Magnetococcus sp. PR-3]|uniref:hypothetical protein n=1 Tax=Magnetococcus sp. PR-3 TaxID=3120355 RepID=UPI002FCE37F6
MSHKPVEQLLARLHFELKGAFVYVPDTQQFDQLEHWSSDAERDRILADHHGVLHGDCDDFALEIRRRAKDQGLPVDLMYCTVPLADGQRGGAFGGACGGVDCG